MDKYGIVITVLEQYQRSFWNGFSKSYWNGGKSQLV